MKKTWTIYRHVNKINGKCYIGITCQRYVRCCWGVDGHGYNQPGQKKFWAAIVKYGWDNFDHEILERGIETPQEANARETYWISFYDSFKNGYNATTGGSGATGHVLSEEKRKEMGRANIGNKYMLGKKHTEETKKKISEKHKGKHLSPKTEFKKGEHHGKEFQIGFIPWNKNKKCPPSWNKGFHGKDNPLAKPIVQYDLNGNFIKEWESAWHIRQSLGFDRSAIARCCRGEYKQLKGYIWRYK